MAGRKKAVGRKARGETLPVLDRALLTTKRVISALKDLKVDPAKFADAYENQGRELRGVKEPSKEEISAVESFMKTGDRKALVSALGGAAKADALVVRVVRWKAEQSS